MYNKSGNILRFETTITDTRQFKVFRTPENDDEKPPSWLKMRNGIADLNRRCELSQKINERYADSICAAKIKETLKDVVGSSCKRIIKKDSSYRALNPWNIEDFNLLSFLVKGGLNINGFRNKDLRTFLFDEKNKARSEQKKKHYSGKATK